MVARFLESHDPRACGCPGKCPSSPQSPKEVLKLTGTDDQALGRREEQVPGVVREDFLLEADYRHSLNYAQNFSMGEK